MQLTVQEALEIYPLSEAKLVAGAAGTSRRMKSVNVMDAPDIADWVKSGELLFTTGFLLRDSHEDATKLLKKLHERGCAGLGVKLGRFWDSIPEAVMAEADRLNFPLLELPFQFTFSDQMNALFRAEYERSTKALQSVVSRQKELMQFALRKNAEASIFAGLSEILDCRIAVVGSRGHILYTNGEWEQEQGWMKGWPWKSAYARVKWDAGSCHRVPIRQLEEDFGFLLVFTESSISFKAEEGLFQQAAEVLAYYMNQTDQVHMSPTSQDEMKAVMMQYLNGRITASELAEYLESRRMSVCEGPYQCVLTTLEPEVFASHTLLKQLYHELQYNPLMKLNPARHFLVDTGILSIFSSVSGQDEGDKLARFLTNRFSDVIATQHTRGEPGPRFWISKQKTEQQGLQSAYQECVETRKLALRFAMKDTALQFDTLEFAYVFQHVPTEIMANYCSKLLEPLVREDPNELLMHTLEAFVEHDGLINEAAKQLYVHRNTVTYRMEKISALLQMDFKKTNDLLKLKMVFTFRKFLKQQKAH
ncbi:PucR family transcriptional regulator [Paenibacillus massiliensis]|uniref:PucR family transcriptional regulator n=1 Tax=Paenibacillus massiliensis TaxID=225917 RepID=UPI00036322D7|nr:PucR family transcriptional regulator [Paenibacillus massiliensis]